MNHIEREEIEHLIIKDLVGALDKEQEKELQLYLAQSPQYKEVYEKIRSDRHLHERMTRYKNIDSEKAYGDFRKRIRKPLLIRLRPFLRYAALLTAIVVTGITYYFISIYEEKNDLSENNRTQQATLILDDGTSIILDESESPSAFLHSSISANKTDSGIVYQQRSDNEQPKYNTLITPRGGEYTVVLSDGTKVHLNSSSELKYPEAFSSNNREVFLKGEAYFIVTRNTKAPFTVNAEGVKVRQYGTSFNINSYDPEAIRVALVKGSIGISTPSDAQEHLLNPSELAEFQSTKNSLTVKSVDLAPYISWHDGELVFDDMPLDEIVFTLSNWYDVDIVISDPELQNLHFTGSVNRSESINSILEALRLTIEVKTSIKDQTIYISKQ